ncbi:MAG TPA: DUF1553 domain-containing protein [Methylomirabilota bacterium]|nr:DUF1553 domain-containing protein [Methylomirabilota bacterium]
MKSRWPSWVLAWAGWSLPVQAVPVDYLQEVKPLLAAHCYRCHGASQQKGGLRLDTAAFARKGGEHGALFEPGRGRESLLLRVLRDEHDSISRMPYKKPPLSEAEMALLQRWVDEGALAPAAEQPETSRHWAFVPPVRPPVPQPAGLDLPPGTNPIDAFIRARLEKEHLRPSPEADRVTLIRRLSLDLLGLPPTPEEVDAFVNDRQPDAYERLVERLLASPHYGERWGRWWLDAARYADSNGYSIDAPRSIWKFRDWVIRALNEDMPFDQFTVWQIAGDLIDTNSLTPGVSPLDPLIATGFHRNTQINQEGGIDPEQFRVESVVDRVNTTATVWLGVTLACAQCHDHKFDPFSQREYYQFYAFFNSTVGDGHGKSMPEGVLEIPGEFVGEEHLQKDLEEAEEDLARYLDTKGSEVVKWEQALTPEDKEKLRPEVRKALQVAFAARTRKQKRIVYAAFRPEDAEFKQRNARVTQLEKNQPKPVTTLVMRELDKPRDTHVFIKGDFTRPGAKVAPGVPAILHPLATSQSRGNQPAVSTPPPENATTAAAGVIASGSGAPPSPASSRADHRREVEPTPEPAQLNRLDLARWLVATNNPLTARVIVNRIWQQYFGRGLVETENDFGTQGTPPSHPELLDWLAVEFMRPEGAPPSDSKTAPGGASASSGPISDAADLAADGPSSRPWSLKHLHRLIVTSATYRQSSKARSDLAEKDPQNKLLARQSRLRLDAEVVRDVLLRASGLLSHKMGGPPVFPPQPDGVMNLGQSKREWKPSVGEDRYRRGIYTHWWRATPHPALAVFDAPDAFSACTRRIRSNTPLQALTLLNDRQFFEMATALATRVRDEPLPSDADRLVHAFRRCVSRPPDADERQRLQALLNQELAAADATTAWTTVARVLLNLDETITRE